MSPGIVIAFGALALIGLVAVVRSLRRSAVRARHGVRVASQAGGVVLRTLATAVAIVGVQWAVVATVADPLAIAAALGIPAPFAGATIARLLTTTDLTASTAQWRHHV